MPTSKSHLVVVFTHSLRQTLAHLLLKVRVCAKILAAPVKGALCFSLYKEYTDHARVSVVNANSHFHFDRPERKRSEPPRYLGRPSFVFARE